MTAAQLAVVLAYPPGTVLRDASGCVWLKKHLTWQRPGSLGDYDSSALVWPVNVLYTPDSATMVSGGRSK